MFRPTVVTALILSALVAGCDAPSEPSPDELSSVASAIEGDEFPPPVTLGEFRDPWFPSSIGVTLVEKAEEGDGYRALVVDLVSKRVVAQVVGPREEYAKVMALITEDAIAREPECGVGQGVFVPPPVPVPVCGTLRCQPGDYIEKAAGIARVSCPHLIAK